MAEKPISPIWANIAKVAREIYKLWQSLGNKEQLKTSDKTNLVAAINELHDRPQGNPDGVSETRVTELINTRLDEIKGGASTAFDTLGELEEQLKKDESASVAILNELGTVKTKVQSLENDITAVKTYIGYTEQDLSVEIDKALSMGAQMASPRNLKDAVLDLYSKFGELSRLINAKNNRVFFQISRNYETKGGSFTVYKLTTVPFDNPVIKVN